MRAPILVGVGQYTERIDDPIYRALSVVELGARAARRACEDALSVERLAPEIDVVAGVRQFEISTPDAEAVFGRSNNFPRSVMSHLGRQPERAVLDITGGQSPQTLVNEFAGAIAAEHARMVLLVGAEAISTQRHLMSQGRKPDWSETVAGSLEDRGYGLDDLVTPDLVRHQLFSPIACYALFDNARRGRLHMSRDEYRRAIGELFAPFTRVAAQNPYAAAPKAYSAEELAAVGERNRLVADPYTRLVVSRDQVNQAAALLLTSVEKARELGIPEDTWVYLHGYASASEHMPMQREDLSRSPAAVKVSEAALHAAGKTMGDMDYIDLYSCFASPVFTITDAFGLATDGSRDLTVTGGLPFFGGAGNNYSMHAIARMAELLRARPGSVGFVGANGGFMSKYAVGIYSTTPAEWQNVDSKPIQDEIDALPSPEVAAEPHGRGHIETYTINYGHDRVTAIIVGRLDDTGQRFLAVSDRNDAETVKRMEQEEPLDRAVEAHPCGKGYNVFTLA